MRVYATDGLMLGRSEPASCQDLPPRSTLTLIAGENGASARASPLRALICVKPAGTHTRAGSRTIIGSGPTN